MKPIPLSDSYFDEVVSAKEGSASGIKRRAIVNALLENRSVLPSPWKVLFGKVQNVTLIVMLLIFASLSAYTIATWHVGDRVRENTIKEIYSGNKVQSDAKKAAMFKEYGLTK